MLSWTVIPYCSFCSTLGQGFRFLPGVQKLKITWHNFIKTSKYSSVLSNYRSISSQSAVSEAPPEALQEIDEGTTGQPAFG